MIVDRERVMSASAAWIWVPEGAVEVCAETYRLIRYPERFWGPSFPPAMVAWSQDGDSAEKIVHEVVDQVDAWRLPSMSWWVSNATPETESALISRGACLVETVQVLARDLAGVHDESAPSPEVSTQLVRDEATLRSATLARTTGWEQRVPSEPQFAADLTRTLRDLHSCSEFKVVAMIGQVPVATGGCEIVDGVARLWGAVTLPAWRGRGAYRAVLRERLILAGHHGADLALVKGRVDTSGPILRRAGFTAFGEERRYELIT